MSKVKLFILLLVFTLVVLYHFNLSVLCYNIQWVLEGSVTWSAWLQILDNCKFKSSFCYLEQILCMHVMMPCSRLFLLVNKGVLHFSLFLSSLSFFSFLLCGKENDYSIRREDMHIQMQSILGQSINQPKENEDILLKNASLHTNYLEKNACNTIN